MRYLANREYELSGYQGQYGLADYGAPCTLSGAGLVIVGTIALIPVAYEFLDWVNGNLKADYHSDAIQLLHAELNFNECQARGDSFCGTWDDYFPIELFGDTINTYMNLVLAEDPKQRIPEFDPSKQTEAAETIERIAIMANLDPVLVARIMTQFYWATQQRRIKTTAFLRPRSTNGVTETPDWVERQRDDEDGPLDAITNFFGVASNLVYVAAIGGLVYVGWNMYQDSKGAN